MSKVTINLTPDQILQAVDQLPDEEKVNLIDKLNNETLQLRWKRLLKRIDAKARKAPRITTKEILKEIDDYRKEKHAKSRH